MVQNESTSSSSDLQEINFSAKDSQGSIQQFAVKPNHPRIEDLRQKMLSYADEHPDAFQQSDVQLLKKTTLWLNRFLNFRGQSFDQAFEHAVGSFRWRKQFQVGHVDLSIVPLEGWLSGAMFIYLPDKESRPVMYMRACMHYKVEPQFYRLLQQLIIYNFTQLDSIADREFGWTVVLDLNNICWANVDLEMLWFLLNTMRYNFPNGCKRIIVYGLPWFLNVLAKTVLAALPADTKAKVRFISGYVLPDPNPEDVILYYKDINQNQRQIRSTAPDAAFDSSRKSSKKKSSRDSECDDSENSSDFEQNVSETSSGTSSNEFSTVHNPHPSDHEIIKQLQNEALYEFIDRKNLPDFLGGLADINYRNCPLLCLPAEQILKERFNYTDQQIAKTLKPFRSIIEKTHQLKNAFDKKMYAYQWNSLEQARQIVIGYIQDQQKSRLVESS